MAQNGAWGGENSGLLPAPGLGANSTHSATLLPSVLVVQETGLKPGLPYCGEDTLVHVGRQEYLSINSLWPRFIWYVGPTQIFAWSPPYIRAEIFRFSQFLYAEHPEQYLTLNTCSGNSCK